MTRTISPKQDGMNMGSTQNRRFGRLPIARLIELIRYKAEALGLVVVTTEESIRTPPKPVLSTTNP